MLTTLSSVPNQRRFWMQITKLVVIKRGEALNPRLTVVHLGFEYRRAHKAERRGFTVNHTDKYVDERFDIVQLQNAKAVTNGTEEHELARRDDGV